MCSRYHVFGIVAMMVAATVQAQTFQVKGASSTVLLSQNTDTGPADRVAVKGISLPQPNWGVGGHFEGGFTGIRSSATMIGDGSRFAGTFIAGNGETANYAVYAQAFGAQAYAGYFGGNVYISGTLTQASDSKLKFAIADLQGALPLVLELRPKTYRYRTEEFRDLNLQEGPQIGLLAQDVATVFPEFVHEVVTPAEKGKGERFLTVDYLKLVPVLIKAVQEQQVQIEALKAELKQLQQR